MYRIYEDYGLKIFVAEFKTLREAKKFLKENDYHPDAEVWVESENGFYIGSEVIPFLQCD